MVTDHENRIEGLTTDVVVFSCDGQRHAEKEPVVLTFDQTVCAELLQARYLVLELASLLDRVDEAAARSECSPADDPAIQQVVEAVRMLAASSAKPDRAERLLRHYSGPEI